MAEKAYLEHARIKLFDNVIKLLIYRLSICN